MAQDTTYLLGIFNNGSFAGETALRAHERIDRALRRCDAQLSGEKDASLQEHVRGGKAWLSTGPWCVTGGWSVMVTALIMRSFDLMFPSPYSDAEMQFLGLKPRFWFLVGAGITAVGNAIHAVLTATKVVPVFQGAAEEPT